MVRFATAFAIASLLLLASAGHAAADAGRALLPIMQTLGSEMTALTDAFMKSDYQTLERSAAAIAEHAPISGPRLAHHRARRTVSGAPAGPRRSFSGLDASLASVIPLGD